MQKALITLFNRMRVPASEDAAPVGVMRVRPFMLEMGIYGYTFDGDLLDRIAALSESQFTALRAEVLREMPEITGTHVRHNVLFKKFPYETPDDEEYLLRRVIGHIQSIFGMRRNDAQVLSCGHVVDPTIFDLDEFGACPICQRQVPELESGENVQHDFKSVTPLKVMALADADFIRGRATAMLGRNSSLSTEERDFLKVAGREYGVDAPPKTVFKENLPLAYELFDDMDYVASLTSSATDVLRIATYVSDPDADLSLSAATKFKVPTKHKKRILTLLEGQRNLEEDMLRHRERWLRLGEMLNPGSDKNRRKYPKTAEAFDVIRNNPGAVATFGRVVEGKVRSNAFDAELLATLKGRPGEFMRRLDLLLRRVTDVTPVLEALEAVASKVTTKMLFEVWKYLEARKDPVGERVFLPKGQVNRAQVVEDKRAAIPTQTLSASQDVLTTELQKRFSALDDMGKVYIDPLLAGIVLPFNKRGDSATGTAQAKGSRLPLSSDAKVIRLFVWWKNVQAEDDGDCDDRVDVDLSAVMYDDDFKPKEQISWTNLRGRGGIKSYHSGDIQDAPEGASEFVDFDVESLRANGVRYVAGSLISFTRQPFNEFKCFAGFMERDALKSGARYEPESVRLKFTVDGSTCSMMPVVFDLKTGDMIYADMASGGRGGTGVGFGKQADKYAALARAMTRLADTKPTVMDVLKAHVAARGQLVDTPAEADKAYTLENYDMEEIMALTA